MREDSARFGLHLDFRDPNPMYQNEDAGNSEGHQGFREIRLQRSLPLGRET